MRIEITKTDYLKAKEHPKRDKEAAFIVETWEYAIARIDSIEKNDDSIVAHGPRKKHPLSDEIPF